MGTDRRKAMLLEIEGCIMQVFRAIAYAAACFIAGAVLAQDKTAKERVEFTRLTAHWAEYADPGYLSFIEEARPDVAQVGFYGAHFWGLAHTFTAAK
jgi:hypothetical protein